MWFVHALHCNNVVLLKAGCNNKMNKMSKAKVDTRRKKLFAQINRNILNVKVNATVVRLTFVGSVLQNERLSKLAFHNEK